MAYKETFAGLAGWLFFPSFVANILQILWYAIKYPKASAAVPFKGSIKHTRDRNRILCGVVLLYLMYLIKEVDRMMEPNFYDTMDLRFHSFTQKQLKTNFKKASLQYHPDKAGQTGTDIFVGIRAAHEVLVDPVLRQAYDRFGSSTFKCTACKSARDYLNNGLQEFFVVYGATVVILVLIGVVGKGMNGRYWRFVLLGAFGALELYLVQSATPNKMMAWVMPNRVTFEQIVILRQIYLSSAMAMSQIGSIIGSSSNKGQVKGASLKESLTRLEALITVSNSESLEGLRSMFDAIRDNDKCMGQMQQRLCRMSLEYTLVQDQRFATRRTSILSRIVAKQANH
ncbi:hypothetical protein BGX28_009666 [Mortierella sp. GBA30]|nr:hypothetical protein BGX28_009666 [Mortierella sp. GBA30]